MTTTNRGSRQSEYQRSIAGAGNVRSGGTSAMEEARPGRAARVMALAARAAAAMVRTSFHGPAAAWRREWSESRSVCPILMGKSLIN